MAETKIATGVINLLIPRCSMYEIFAYIWLSLMVNVGKCR